MNQRQELFNKIISWLENNTEVATGILSYKNVSVEMARLGMAQVVVYQHKKPFIYQEQLLKVQEEAKLKKLGIWSL